MYEDDFEEISPLTDQIHSGTSNVTSSPNVLERSASLDSTPQQQTKVKKQVGVSKDDLYDFSKTDFGY